MKAPSAGIVVAGVAIVVLGILFGINRYYHLSKDDAAALGDVFNAVNSLFAGLAFLGLIWAILLQRAELRLQRKELQLTRREMKRQAQAQEDSGKALERQANTLLLAAHLDAITSLLSSKPKAESLDDKIERGILLRRLEAVANTPEAFLGNSVFSVSYSGGVAYHLREKTKEFEGKVRMFRTDWENAPSENKGSRKEKLNNYLRENVCGLLEEFQKLAQRKGLSCFSLIRKVKDELWSITEDPNEKRGFNKAISTIEKFISDIEDWEIKEANINHNANAFH